jgi:hypothetical protein
MWEPRRLTILWASRPVIGIALPFFLPYVSSFKDTIIYNSVSDIIINIGSSSGGGGSSSSSPFAGGLIYSTVALRVVE